MTDVWFTSDTHFGHNNIIKYCNRPFDTVERMNAALIDNHNSLVKPNDIVYHLGDFAYKSKDGVEKFVNRLNGKIYLILGNHDKLAHVKDAGFEWIGDYKEVKVDKQFIVLSHYAFRVWNKSHKGSINLFGHSHNNLPGNSQQTDVGVDAWNYFPVNLEQIQKRLKTSPPYIGEDHHGHR